MKKGKLTALLVVLTTLTLTACGGAKKYKAGTYEGSGRGYSKEGAIKVSVTIDESGSIYDAKVLEQTETKEIGGKALDRLLEQLSQKKSENIDTVSGATRTSEGFRQAVKEALKKAGK